VFSSSHLHGACGVQVPANQPCFKELAITLVFEAASVQQADHALSTLLSLPAICSLLDGRVQMVHIKTNTCAGCCSDCCHLCFDNVVSVSALHAHAITSCKTQLLLAGHYAGRQASPVYSPAPGTLVPAPGQD
jgi:hypothetical protein